MIVRKVNPAIAVGGVILTHCSPLSLSQIRTPALPIAGALRILWFGVSWALFIVATGMLIAGELRFVRGVYVPMVLPLAIVGFAMVTMPFAWGAT